MARRATSATDDATEIRKPMDLESLKGKTLDDKLHAELSAYVADLASQRDTARKESIEGRKGKDKRISELSERVEALSERLGVEPDADLSSIPSGKGQAEAARQFEAQIKRLTRERDEAVKARDELNGKLTGEKRDRAIAEAVSKHPFIDADDARTLIASRVRQEGDEFVFESEAGKMVPIADGAAWIAKTKPHLVQPQGGAGGSGYMGGASGGSGKAANPWVAKTFNLTEQLRIKAENPALAEQLKGAASAA